MLSKDELIQLVKSVFPPFPEDRFLGILVDIPRDPLQDTPAWKDRRRLAADWYETLRYEASSIPLDGVRLIAYPDTGSNNADLPETAVLISKELPETAYGLERYGTTAPFAGIYRDTQIFLAPTEFSATAPLKNAAKIFGFRAATMPGFSADMLPALRINYTEVSRRVNILKEKLDPAQGAEIRFEAAGLGRFKMFFDLRRREAHTSSGRFPEKGTAGNLPSGETYIVPFESEESVRSRTRGKLPVELGGEVLLYTVKENRAVKVEGKGSAATGEQAHLTREPAYGNMAELGFGVLEDFGIKPTGELLLDEKLGLHIAFGRSDHLGGTVGTAAFFSPKEVVHIDRIYIPATQPQVKVRSVALEYSGGKTEDIMKDGKYLIF